MPNHTISPAVFEAIASGRPDPVALQALAATQLSKRLLLLRAVIELGEPVAPAPAVRALTGAPRELLHETLMYPHTGALLAACLRGEADLTGLAGALSGRPGVRVLKTPSFIVYLDDVDEHRAPPRFTGSPRLSDDEVATWQELLAEAWDVLTRWHPSRAADIAAGVRVLTPLTATGADTGISASCREQFGAIALTRPGDGLELAVTLVHELQHSKFNALLDSVELVSSSAEDGMLHYAPWREDPRPLKALLNGTHAFVAVASFWHEQWLTGSFKDRAAYELAHVASQVGQALQTLTGADGFTPEGRRFLAAMVDASRRWDINAVAGQARDLARLAATEHRTRWRLNNLAPDTESVARLADAWGLGSAPLMRPRRPTLTPVPDRFTASSRMTLLIQLAADPASGIDPARYPDLLDGDVQLLRGDYRAAIDSYQRLLRAEPGHLMAWTGLAVACTMSGEAVAWQELPETIRALHGELTRRAAAGLAPPPSALDLARWLAGGEQADSYVGGGSMSFSSRR